MSDVRLLARWTGWCDPCEVERPLVLTETGQRGLRAWLRGVGPEDRGLTLTCAVCGEWQAVPHDEADLSDSIDLDASAPVLALQPLGAHQVVVARVAAPTAYPVEPVTVRLDSTDASLDLLAEGLDLITLGAR